MQISVDDFGTGYSSMSNLRHLPISELKIDRSFVSGMLLGGNDQVIVSSAIALGHNLGMSVVAEGVETPELEAQLRAVGCDSAQGYGTSRPLPLTQLDQFLLTTRPAITPPQQDGRLSKQASRGLAPTEALNGTPASACFAPARAV